MASLERLLRASVAEASGDTTIVVSRENRKWLQRMVDVYFNASMMTEAEEVSVRLAGMSALRECLEEKVTP